MFDILFLHIKLIEGFQRRAVYATSIYAMTTTVQEVYHMCIHIYFFFFSLQIYLHSLTVFHRVFSVFFHPVSTIVHLCRLPPHLEGYEANRSRLNFARHGLYCFLHRSVLFDVSNVSIHYQHKIIDITNLRKNYVNYYWQMEYSKAVRR